MSQTIDFFIRGNNQSGVIIWINTHHIGKSDLDFTLGVNGLSPVSWNDSRGIITPLVPSFMEFVITITKDETKLEFLSNFTLGNLVFFIIVVSRDEWVGGIIASRSDSVFFSSWSNWEGTNHILSGKDSHGWGDRSIVVHGFRIVLGEDIFNLGTSFLRLV